YRCEIKISKLIDAQIPDPAGFTVQELKIPNKKDFYDLVYYLYYGAPGILERKNVLLVEAPGAAMLEPKQILDKAASMYREAYSEKQTGFRKPES
ncbi:MAG: hypothetical protein AAF492_29965, partial [Verrucomicrobiota bacterium]